MFLLRMWQVLFSFLRVPQMSETNERVSADEGVVSVLAHFSFGSIAEAGYVGCE
jgi:hypothetical protein